MEVAIAGGANRKLLDVRKYNRKIAWLSSEISILLGFNVRISCPNFDREFRPPHHFIILQTFSCLWPRTLRPAGCHSCVACWTVNNFFRPGETRLILFSLFEFEYTLPIKAPFGLNYRIPGHFIYMSLHKKATIVIYLVLQSTPTYVNAVAG